MSFGFRTGLFVTVACTVTVIIFSFLYYNFSYDLLFDRIASRLAGTGKTGQLVLDDRDRMEIRQIDRITDNLRDRLTPSEIEQIPTGDVSLSLSPGQIQSITGRPGFQRIVQKLRLIRLTSVNDDKTALTPRQKMDTFELHRLNPYIRYVYLLVPVEESPDLRVVKFIADVDPQDADLNGNGIIDSDEQGTPPGMLYNIEDQPQLQKAFSGSAEISESYFQDYWGVWFSAYIPVFGKDGQVIAVMGIDISAAKEFKAIEELRFRIYLLTTGAFLASLLIGVLSGYWTGKPLSRLSQSLPADFEPAGNLSVIDNITEYLQSQQRELSGLNSFLQKDASDIMNRMSLRIRESAKILKDPELSILFDVFTGRQEHKRLVECRFSDLPVRGLYEERQISSTDRRRIFVLGVPPDSDSLTTRLALTVFFYLLRVKESGTAHLTLEFLTDSMSLILKETGADIDIICGLYDPDKGILGTVRKDHGQLQFQQTEHGNPLEVSLSEGRTCTLTVTDRAVDDPQGFLEVETLIEKGDYINAINFIDSGDNWSPPAYFHRAEAYYGLGKYALALKDLTVVSRFFQSLEHALYPVCNVLKKTGNAELSNRLISASETVQRAGRPGRSSPQVADLHLS